MVSAVSHIYIAAYGPYKFPVAMATSVPCEAKSTVCSSTVNFRLVVTVT